MLKPLKTIAVLLILTTASCRSHATSDLLITNGVRAFQNFPDVVKLVSVKGGACTGTFVSRTTLITAAHCAIASIVDYQKVQDFSTDLEIVINSKPVRAWKVFIHPGYTEDDAAKSTDLAVVIFFDKVAPGVRKLGAKSPNICDPVTIVGYGMSDLIAKSEVGFKHSGENTVENKFKGLIEIDGALESGFINIPGPQPKRIPVPPGESASTGPGDSGGPMLWNETLVGVLSGGPVFVKLGAQTNMSFYVDLQQADNQAFLRSTVAQGADIPFPESSPTPPPPPPTKT